jgi:sec-independent protein translocase protein TatC
MPEQIYKMNIFQRIGNSLRAIFSVPRRLHEYFTEVQEDTPILDTVETVFEHPQDVLPHIFALRSHLLRVVIYLVVTTAVSFLFITPIMEFLARPLSGGIEALRAVDVTEGVGTVMRVSLLSGFALAFPLIAFEVWSYAAPAMHGYERLWTLLAIPIASLFFISGLAFAYFIMLPAALPVLLSFMGLKTLPRPNSYFPFVVNLLFWMGVAFEFPLVIMILARLGVVKARDLLNQWRLAIVIIAVLSAAITTTTDPANMALTMLPMIALYFLSIGLAKLAQRQRKSHG